jgi:hypothetical protein
MSEGHRSRVSAVADQSGRAVRRTAPHQIGIIANRKRTACQIALNLVASFLQEERALGLLLDAFGEHRNFEAVRQPDDRADNRRGMMIVLEVGNEGTIDLDFVEGKGVQIRQRRISLAEIVQRDLHAKPLKLAQNRNGAREVVDQDAFGDFEFEP